MGALSAITIRPAVEADLPALHALVERAYRGETSRGGWTHEADILGGPRTSAAELARALADSHRAILVAAEDEALIGSVEVADLGRGLAYLGLLSVDPGRQANGLGRRLVAAAEGLAREAFGAARMEMTVIAQRAGLIAWYERLGFTRTGEERPFPHAVKDVIFHTPTPPTMVVLERRLRRA